MNTYEEALIEYLSQKENFEGLLIAKNAFPVVRDRLVENFWLQTEAALRELVNSEDWKDWEVGILGNIGHVHTKLYIRRKQAPIKAHNMPAFAFMWESLGINKPYYGFWMNLQDNSYDYPEIRIYLQEQRREFLGHFKDDGNWWPFFQYDETVRFEEDINLTRLVDEGIGEKSKDTAQKLFDFFRNENMQQAYLELNGNKFKV